MNVKTETYFGHLEESVFVISFKNILYLEHSSNTKQGGGSTFGVLTSVTIRAFPSSKFVTASVLLGTTQGTEAYWDATSYILSRFPELDSQGISAYCTIAENTTAPELNITSTVR